MLLSPRFPPKEVRRHRDRTATISPAVGYVFSLHHFNLSAQDGRRNLSEKSTTCAGTSRVGCETSCLVASPTVPQINDSQKACIRQVEPKACLGAEAIAQEANRGAALCAASFNPDSGGNTTHQDHRSQTFAYAPPATSGTPIDRRVSNNSGECSSCGVAQSIACKMAL